MLLGPLYDYMQALKGHNNMSELDNCPFYKSFLKETYMRI